MTDSSEDRSGCALHCLAYLSGRTYDEVRALWIESGGDAWQLKAVGHAGLTVADVQQLARLLGVTAPVIQVQGPAILLLVDERRFGHYVVATSAGQIVDVANLRESENLRMMKKLAVIDPDYADDLLKRHGRLELNMTDPEKLAALEAVTNIKFDMFWRADDPSAVIGVMMFDEDAVRRLMQHGSPWQAIIATHSLNTTDQDLFREFVHEHGFTPAAAKLEDLDALISEWKAQQTRQTPCAERMTDPDCKDFRNRQEAF